MLYSEIIGQNSQKNSLINQIKRNNLSHCYIFEGPKDIGKYQLSLVFAQSLLCKDFNTEPCNLCSSCNKLNSMNHPDLHILNTEEKNIKREDVDSLIELFHIKPYESDKKIFIINECEKMTTQAANSFLKTLEEPIGDSIIILLTNNINMLLDTIVSRCQIIKLKTINKKEIEKILIEKYNADEMNASIVSYYSKGILNKAVNIITEKDDILKIREQVIMVFDKIINMDSSIIFEYEKYFEDQKDDIDKIIEILMIWIRDVNFYKNDLENLIANKDFISLIKIHANKTNSNDLNRLIQYLQFSSDNIKYSVNYKLIIDKMLLKIQEEFKV